MTMIRRINAGTISRVSNHAGVAALTEALLPSWHRAHDDAPRSSRSSCEQRRAMLLPRSSLKQNARNPLAEILRRSQLGASDC